MPEATNRDTTSTSIATITSPALFHARAVPKERNGTVVILPDPIPIHPTREHLLRAIRNSESRITAVASRVSLPADVRAELLAISHPLLELLIRAGVEV
jgi:hypothetical protein